MRINTRRLFFVLSLFSCAVFFQCSDSGEKPVEPPVPAIGALGGPCFEDDTCDSGLICLNDVCTVGDVGSTYTVKITAPVENEEISASQYKVTAEAEGVERVVFSDGNKVISEDTDGSDGWTADWDTAAAVDGEYQVSAKAYISEDIVAESSPVKVNIKKSFFSKVYDSPTFTYAAFQSIQETKDGGFVVAGYANITGTGANSYFLVLKVKADGEIEWQKTYAGAGVDYALNVKQTPDGGYVVVGSTTTFGKGGSDAWVIKLKSDGGIEWQKTFGGPSGDRADSVSLTSDGGFVVAGHRVNPSSSDAWVVKFKSNGGIEWQKFYGQANKFDKASSVEQTSDGGYIIAGSTIETNGTQQDGWVFKTNANGTLEWQKSYGTVNNSLEFLTSIHQTADGGYIVGGTDAAMRCLVLKLKGDGSVEWQKRLKSGSDTTISQSVKQTADGGFIVATYFQSDSGAAYGLIAKLKADGGVEWQRSYNGDGGETFSDIGLTSDGGYVVAGQTDQFTELENPEPWILRLKSDGTVDPSCPAWLGAESQQVEFIAGNLIPATTSYPASDASSIAGVSSSATAIDADLSIIDQCHN